jgi:hypothetical protein
MATPEPLFLAPSSRVLSVLLGTAPRTEEIDWNRDGLTDAADLVMSLRDVEIGTH